MIEFWRCVKPAEVFISGSFGLNLQAVGTHERSAFFEISKRKVVRAALSNQDAFETCRITVASVLTLICDGISWRWWKFFTERATCVKLRHSNKWDRMVWRRQSQTFVLDHWVWIDWPWHNKVHYPLSMYMRYWTNRIQQVGYNQNFSLLHLSDVSMFPLK